MTIVNHQGGDPALRIGTLNHVDQLVCRQAHDLAVELGDQYLSVRSIPEPLDPLAQFIRSGGVPEMAQQRSDGLDVA